VEAIHAEQAVVDVSHASDAAAREVVELAQRARRPVVATHSNARAVADHPRNLPDDLIKAIADTGGVIGANFHGPYLARDRRASLADVVAHIEHLVKVAGLDHVAIGSDFEGGIRPPEGMRDVEGYQELAEALLLKGWARADVAKIFAANALRVLCPP
jgi:membrane dipeptidase